jgi:hypothetical protein
MMRSSYLQPSVRLWWRRQVFYLRRLPFKWFVLVLICILLLITNVPNPFSSKYTRISIIQDEQWDNINELIQIKEQVDVLTEVYNCEIYILL